MRTLAVVTTVLLAASGAPLEYRFEKVQGKVVVETGRRERRATEGAPAFGGERVTTGLLGRAVLSVPGQASRFELFPLTRAVLGSHQPGILLELQKGKLWAVFDAIVGNQERLVATPGAVLAVRGTAYGVEVSGDGETELAVFEGTVEVRSTLPEVPPLLVPAGQVCAFSPKRAPVSRPMPREVTPESWRHGRLQPPGGARDEGTPGGVPGGASRRPSPGAGPRRP